QGTRQGAGEPAGWIASSAPGVTRTHAAGVVSFVTLSPGSPRRKSARRSAAEFRPPKGVFPAAARARPLESFVKEKTFSGFAPVSRATSAARTDVSARAASVVWGTVSFERNPIAIAMQASPASPHGAAFRGFNFRGLPRPTTTNNPSPVGNGRGACAAQLHDPHDVCRLGVARGRWGKSLEGGNLRSDVGGDVADETRGIDR